MQGVALFKNIFEIAPQALQLFSFKDEPNLYESPKLKKHGKMVIKAVEKALFEFVSQTEALKSLGERHVPNGVVPAHYDVVG